jgi:hypothetical protein
MNPFRLKCDLSDCSISLEDVEKEPFHSVFWTRRYVEVEQFIGLYLHIRFRS